MSRRDPSVIAVTGRGDVSVKPDVAIARLGAEARRPTLAEATADATQRMNAVLECARSAGVAHRKRQRDGRRRAARGRPVASVLHWHVCVGRWFAYDPRPSDAPSAVASAPPALDLWKLEARRRMNVIAFSSPTRPDWRWRIVTNAGEVIEESRTTFGSISEAVAKGRRRLEDLDIDDRSERPRTFGRSTSHLRSR